MQRIIGGIACHRYLKKINPKLNKIRPTSDKVREALFNILTPYIENAEVLDLFAGSGAVGIEALSRGAKACTFIEQDINNYRLIRDNLSLLDFTNGEVYLKSADIALKILYKKQNKFDIIFLDPPYFQDVPPKIGSMNLKRQNLYGNIGISFYE
ncbi:16S rRNA (guanine(966)-N(2))-methyltransferase RsmD [Candidatus Desantisbacteria bacterium]|nr:16S rRNA (guanine(966)-N(2))-methyltransferase RsmD [Candidatus Desantisbacteria bacterium]